jgi:hypothetical protein
VAPLSKLVWRHVVARCLDRCDQFAARSGRIAQSHFRHAPLEIDLNRRHAWHGAQGRTDGVHAMPTAHSNHRQR